MAELDNGEVGKSYDDMSIEEIEAELQRTGGVIQDDEPVEAAPKPEPEPVPEPEAADEPVEAREEDAPEEVEAVGEEELPDEQELRMQEMQLELERVRQERERFEYQAGRNSGEVGYLKKELERLRTAPPQQEDPYAESDPVQPQQQSVPSHLEGQVAELRAEQAASAVERVYSEFLNRVQSDLMAQGVGKDDLVAEQNSIMEKITPTLKDRFEPFGDVSSLGTKSMTKVTRMVLDGAYTDVKLAKVADLRKRASERRATQIAESKIVKQAASPSGSGGRPVKESPPKSPEEMTAEEADAALEAQFGTGRGMLRSRR